MTLFDEDNFNFVSFYETSKKSHEIKRERERELSKLSAYRIICENKGYVQPSTFDVVKRTGELYIVQ